MVEKNLLPSDPPILLAGLIAARQCGDKPLAKYFAGELWQRYGIEIHFVNKLNQRKGRGNRTEERT
jgi:hypothetical protein